MTTTATASSTPSTTSTASVPGPTTSGIPSNCNKYYVVQTGDTCPSVESKFGITSTEFFAWNPSVSTDCTTHFWVGEAY
ncbi:hypothetical protein DTO217A2_3340 [Paecilomyces variotii]|nr:hypothetical protein DTO217A2_3340 [Paecilomyces variotii]